MLEAQRRYDLLVQRATPDVVEATIEHARALFLNDQTDPDLAAEFRAAADALTQHSTNATDALRAWTMLRRRVQDERVSARLAEISDSLVVGATSGGEVSAATLAFPDHSYLMMMDHGLSNLTWLIAQLYVVSRRTPLLGRPAPADAVDVRAAAQTLRLATSRIAGGGRAGVNPSLVLTGDELALAGALVGEIDVFVVAHETAHILLQHVGHDRAALGIVDGSSRLLGHRPQEEAAADLLAITMQLDDLLIAGEGNERMVALRLTAVRLFLALLELYERSMFVVQPTSHPPAVTRWRTIVSRRLARWFDDVDELLPGAGELVDALGRLDSVPRLTDASAVHNGLGDRLDQKLWSFYDWSHAATLGHVLLPTPPEAFGALTSWSGWPNGVDIETQIGRLVAETLASEAARDIVLAAATGSEVISRLAAATALTAHLDAAHNNSPGETDLFPSWAIAAIALNAIAGTVGQDHGAS